MPSDGDKIRQLLSASISYYKLEDANSPYGQPLWYNRCRELVAHFVGDFSGSWMEWEHGGYGFLERRGSTICKSPEFEEAWKARRDLWQRQLYSAPVSVIPDTSRLDSEASNSPQTGANQKRVRLIHSGDRIRN